MAPLCASRATKRRLGSSGGTPFAWPARLRSLEGRHERADGEWERRPASIGVGSHRRSLRAVRVGLAGLVSDRGSRRPWRVGPTSLSRELLRNLLVLELSCRRRNGESLTPGEYRTRFPEHAQLIDSLFRELIRAPGLASLGRRPYR